MGGNRVRSRPAGNRVRSRPAGNRIAALALVALFLAVLLGTAPSTAWGATLEADPPGSHLPLTSSAAGPQPYVPGEILVAFQPVAGTMARALAEAASSLQATPAGEIPALGIVKLRLPPGLSVEEALEQLRRNPSVRYAEPNYRLRIAENPVVNDGYYPQQWGLHGSAGINWETVWQYVYGNQSSLQPVTVAVIDTGMYKAHPDFSGREILEDLDWDFVNNVGDASDDHGHGTQVTGIIAAATNNGRGVAGVAGNTPVKILPVKALDNNGEGNLWRLISAIQWAVDKGADVLNLSLGFPEGLTPEESQSLLQAIAYAHGQNGGRQILIAAAAGNNGAAVLYPAAYDGVLAVSATDSLGARATFSSQGPEVDLAGPGVGIWSTLWDSFDPGGEYYAGNWVQGTSMAAAFVTGMAAVLKAVHPDWNPYQLAAAMLYTARDLDTPGYDERTGRGLLDGGTALNTFLSTDPPPPARITAPAPSTTISGSITVIMEVYFPELVSSVELFVDSTAGIPVYSGTVTGSVYREPVELSFNWTPQAPQVSNGSHNLIAVGYGFYGEELGRDQVQVTVDVPSGPGNGGGGTPGGGGGPPGGGLPMPAPDVERYLLTGDEQVVEAFGGEVVLQFPAGTAPRGTPLLVKVIGRDAESRQAERPGGESPAGEGSRTGRVPARGGLVPVSRAFDLALEGATPGKPVTIALKYDRERLGTIDPRQAAVYRQEGETTPWGYVGGRVDAASGKVVASLGAASTPDPNGANPGSFGNGLGSPRSPGIPGRYAVFTYTRTFPDLAGHWARRDIEVLVGRYILKGVNEGEFQPDRAITRAEMAGMLVEALEVPVNPPAVPTFADVPASAWYYGHVEAAAARGLVRGDEHGFRPGDPITREEMAAVYLRALGLEAQAVQMPSGEEDWRAGIPFDDREEVAPWARGYVALAHRQGIMRGLSPTRFGPRETTTRAQAAVMTLRLMERMELLEVSTTVEGRLVVNEIEGRHYELEAAGRIYVLLVDPANRELGEWLESRVGRQVRVTGVIHSGPTIYMRGTPIKVLKAETVTRQG